METEYVSADEYVCENSPPLLEKEVSEPSSQLMVPYTVPTKPELEIET
jgi:hypothetical protein